MPAVAGSGSRTPGSPQMSPWFPYLDCTAATPALCLCSLRQGYGDHKPKSSTAAQEVKTLDGIFTEQVSGGLRASEKLKGLVAERRKAVPDHT